MKAMWIAAALALGGAAFAAETPAKPPCENFAWPMAREAAAFAAPGAAVASGTALEAWPGGAVPVALVPLAEAALPSAPERAPKDPAAAKAGFVTLPAPAAGLYQVTLNGRLWIDVVQDGKTVPSGAHSSDASCPAFHKSVRFVLGASPVTLQYSGEGADSVTFTILPAE